MDWHTIWNFVLEHIKEGGIWFWLFLASEALSEVKALKDNSIFQMVRRLFRFAFFFKSGKKLDDLDK